MTSTPLDVAKLYASERGRIWRLVQRIVRNQAVADDLVQDSFVNLLGAASKCGNVQDERSYLSRIARNLAIDQKRRERETLTLEDAGIFAMADPIPSAEQVVADRQALKLTFDAMASLPERTRRALEMHRLGECTLAEIGRTLGVSTAQAGRLVLSGYSVVRDRLREAGA
jgi:RNA polymerase sigma-70 factor (ECF subfamily)